MIPKLLVHVRLADAMMAIAATFAGLLASSQALAYSEFGYFSGAYASPGESGCMGAKGQGVNPYGGCAPGDYPLKSATAFVYGAKGNNNFASLTADLSTATVSGSSQFPDGASTHPFSAANFLDTVTITGNLPNPVNIVVTLTVDATVSGTPTYGSPVQALLLNAGGIQASYERNLSTCYWAILGGSTCDEGYGRTVRSITHTETVSDANRSFQVASVLNLGGSYLLIDASATTSFSLPAGLSYTSASGVFASAVPEPGTWALMVAGIGVLGALRTRQRAASARAASGTSAGPR